MPERDTLFLAVLGTCIVNGIFSPYLKIAIPITAALMPELFPRTIEWVLFWSSILLSSATLLISGVPAALYERWGAGSAQGAGPTWIWLACALVLSLPAVIRFL